MTPNSNLEDAVAENQSSSTASWIAHRAYLTPASLKRGRNPDSLNTSKNGSSNLNRAVERPYKSVLSHTSNPFNQNFNDEYDPRFPNDYEKVSKIFSINLHTKSVPKAQIPEEPASRKDIPEQREPEPRLSGDEMLKRRLEAMQRSELYAQTEGEKVDSPVGLSQPEDAQLEVKMGAEPKKGQPIALKMMEKMGWKEGVGLGKNEQGMVTPLMAKQTGKNSAVIVNAVPKLGVKPEKKVHSEPQLEGPKSRVAVLVFPSTTEVDLEEMEEIASEYGSLINLVLLSAVQLEKASKEQDCLDMFERHPVAENQFLVCEYETEEQSKRLILALDGQYVMESRVKVRYFPLDVYNTL